MTDRLERREQDARFTVSRTKTQVLNRSRYTTSFIGFISILGTACGVPGEIERLESEPEGAAGIDGGPDGFATTQRPVAIVPGFDLVVEPVGGDLVLNWADAGAGATYTVWQSLTAGFEVGNEAATIVASGLVGTSTIVVAAAGGDNDFYRVRAEVGGVTLDSTIAGEAVTQVYPGINELGLSLFPNEPTSAGIEGGVTGVSEVRSWDAGAQQFDTWLPWTGAPPIPVEHGEAVWLGALLEEDHMLYGQVPAVDESSVALVPGWNMIVMPLTGPGRMASDLLPEVAGSLTIAHWSAENGGWVNLTADGSGADFELPSGSGFWIRMSGTGSWEPVICGNGLVEADEVCDDGNWADGDGCQADCTPTPPPEGAFLFTVRVTDDVLQVLDTETLTLTDIGPLGVAFDFGELSWDSTTGTMWMIDGRPQESLYTVDITTGAATFVGTHGITDLFGLAHDPTTNTLYGSGESPTGFYSMNTTTGAATLIGDPGLAADGLTYDPVRDQIVALQAGQGQMYAIDRATGAASVLSDEGFINNTGLAHEPAEDMFWAIDWSGNLYSYDPADAYSRVLELGGLGGHCGLTHVPGFTL